MDNSWWLRPILWRIVSIIIGVSITIWQGLSGVICTMIGMLLGAWICRSALESAING